MIEERIGIYMEEQFKNQLKLAGVNVGSTVSRFMGREDLYEKFLGKFVEDGSFSSLKAAMEKQDYIEMFKVAHTLKGVAGNLGLADLEEADRCLVEVLRGVYNSEVSVKDMDWNRVVQNYGQVEEAYKKVMDVLNAYYGQKGGTQ